MERRVGDHVVPVEDEQREDVRAVEIPDPSPDHRRARRVVLEPAPLVHGHAAEEVRQRRLVPGLHGADDQSGIDRPEIPQQDLIRGSPYPSPQSDRIPVKE
jgi:hypothetical protein